jgi:hypothetical protein
VFNGEKLEYYRMRFSRFLLLPVVALAAFAQSAIEGVVLDPTGAAVPGATIRATLETTGAVRTVDTDASGRYRIPALTIGDYTIECEKPGFQRAQIQHVHLGLDQTVQKTISLNLAAAGATVNVIEKPDAIDPAATTAGVGISGEALEEMPVQTRSYLGAALYAPGVAPAAGSDTLRTKAGVRSANPDSGFTVAGMRARNNSLSIDGLDNRDETTGASRVSIGQEAVAEFRVTASDVAPEFGGGAGGILNVVTLSGTNKYHGDVNLWAADSFLEARSPESESATRPYRRQWQPEAALNGPLKRDRLFFAGTVEGELENSQEFSEIPGPKTQSLMNAALASPMFSRAAVSSLNVALFPTESKSLETSGKLTYLLGTAHQLSARYAYSRASNTREVLGVDNFSDESARGSSRNQDQSFAAGWQYVPNASFINELRGQFARTSIHLTPNSEGALLEIPGIVSIGESPLLNASRTEDHFQVVDAATILFGAHQLGFGASVQRINLDSRLADYFSGVYVFPTLNDFVRGTPDMFLQAFGDPHTRYSTTPSALWAQDQWRAAAGLTVVYGIRYEEQPLPAPFGPGSHNIAPRLGIAWQPHGQSKWVFRAGAGLFYDRYPLAFLNEAIQKNGTSAFEQYAVGAEAAVAFQLSHGGTLASSIPNVAPSIFRPGGAFDATPTYSRKFTAGLERAIDRDTTLTVEYMNISGFHLPRIRNRALTLPPQYDLELSASSAYQGATVTLHRRLTNEVTYLLAYTAGSAWDDASDFTEQPMNPANARLDWSRSRQYQAQRVVASALFDLPLEDLSNKWLKAIGQDLDLAPAVSFGTPRPVNAVDTTDLDRTGAYPITARPLGFSRNPFYVRGMFSVDARLTKGFRWWKDHGIFLFGIGVYNLTNHTNPLKVSEYYGLTSYRGLIETLNARQVQWSWQWEF